MGVVVLVGKMWATSLNVDWYVCAFGAKILVRADASKRDLDS
jgi:hypothetical protein